MPQLSTPPSSKNGKSSHDARRIPINEHSDSPSIASSSSPASSTKKSGSGFFNKLLKKKSTTSSSTKSASSTKSSLTSSSTLVGSNNRGNLHKNGSKSTGGRQRVGSNASSSSMSSFTHGANGGGTALSPLSPTMPATSNGTGKSTPEGTRSRKNSLTDRRAPNGKVSQKSSQVRNIFDHDDHSMYDDDDHSSSGESAISSSENSMTSSSFMDSKTDLNHIEEQILNSAKTGDVLKYSDLLEKTRLNVDEPSLSSTAIGSGELDLDADQWANIPLEALYAPKHIRISKRKKHSPKVFENLFLAQELKASDETLNTTTNDLDSLSNESDSHPFSSNSSFNEANPDESYFSDTANHSPINPKNIPNGANGKDDKIDHVISSSSDKSNNSNKNEIFVMEFSRDGKYLAAAGRDACIRIWKVIASPLARLEYKSHSEALKKYAKASRGSRKSRPYPYGPVFHDKPVRTFYGHTHNILALDWSKNNFLVSGSMDRTVKVWHVDRSECLETFAHEDFVTSVKFHPTDDRFFLSGSLDNKLRFWSILEKNIAYVNDLGDEVLITAVAFTPDGLRCFAGGFNGSIFSLETKGLHVLSRYEVQEKHFVNPFHDKNGKKITGIKVFENTDFPLGVADDEDEEDDDKSTKDGQGKPKAPKREDPLAGYNFLVTTNDSKIRLVNSHQKKLVTRFRGLTNTSSSIVASISHDNKYIISGSEDHWCYVWKNNNSIINNKLKSTLTELLYEGKHQLNDLSVKHKKYSKLINENRFLRKFNIQKFLESGGSEFKYEYIANENSSYSSFHAHHSKVNAAIFAPLETSQLLELSDDYIFDLVKRENMHSNNEIDRGYIIVTSDQQGNIRVFRNDTASEIRKKILPAKKRYMKKKLQADAKSEAVDPCLETPRESSGPHCPSNRMRRNLSMKGRSLSPVHSNIKNIIHGKKIKASNSAVTTPTSSTPNTLLNTPSSTVSEFPSVTSSSSDSTRPSTLKGISSSSIVSGREAPKIQPAAASAAAQNGMFTNHVAVDLNCDGEETTLKPSLRDRDRSSSTITKQDEEHYSLANNPVPLANSKPKVPLIVSTKPTRNSSELVDFHTPVTSHSPPILIDQRIGDVSFHRSKSKHWEDDDA